jgi:solute carrier family 45 protein 1/2/4
MAPNGLPIGWRSRAICSSGFAVEFAWATGESVMIPHLVHLGASPTFAASVYVANPLIGMFVQPLVGKASDCCESPWGKRSPFIAGLALLACCGCCTLVASHTLASAIMHFNGASNTTIEIVLCFCAFGVADIAHDLILVPGRALAVDSMKDSNEADALYTMAQLFGRLLALVVGSTPLLSNLFEPFLGPLSHFQAVLLGSVVLLGTCSSLAISSAREWQMNSNAGYEEIQLAEGRSVQQGAPAVNDAKMSGRKRTMLWVLLCIQFLGT